MESLQKLNIKAIKKQLKNMKMTKMNRFFLVFILSSLLIKAQHASDTLKTVTIGTQIWSSENLNVTKFKNGDEIFEAKTRSEWQKAGKEKTPAWCYYDFDESKGVIYGKLYNWYAMSDSRGLAPDGWHIPVNSEWDALIEFLPPPSPDAGMYLKTKKGWKGKADRNNKTGFSALPSGLCDDSGGFHYLKTHASFWSASDATPKNEVWSLNLYPNNNTLQKLYDKSMACGYSVRCLKNK